MFQHINDLVELDDSGPKAWKLLRDVIQPNTLPMVIVLEKELAALSMRPGDDMQQCTKIISVLDNSWDNLIPTLNTQQDQWTPEWLRQQILQEDFRRRHTGGGAANKTAEGYGAAGGSRGRGGGRGRGRGRCFGRGRGRGDYNEGHGSSGGRGSTRMEGACWYCKKAGHPWFKCFSRPEGWAPPGMKPPSGERARGGAVQGSGAQGKANPGMFLMVEDVKGSEGDVGSVGKVVMHPLTHWVIDSGCTSHMTPRADLLDEVKPPGKIKFVAAASGALLPVIGVGNAKRLQRGAADLSKGEMLLTCYTDASFNSVKADGTSIGGYVCLFGGGAVSWRSKKQNEAGLSSCETEYMALHHGVKEVVWLRRLLEEIGVCQKEPTVILCDNESAVKLANNA
ncbi:unnamed protein product, partial [Closterium sp. NIES-53]